MLSSDNIIYSPASGRQIKQNIKYKIKGKNNLTNKKIHQSNYYTASCYNLQ